MESAEPARRVGARIAAIRRHRGLTQAQVAARIGRSANALASLERGRTTPPFNTLLLLGRALGVSAGDFFAPLGAADGEGGEGGDGSPKQAALFGDLLDSARVLPPVDLELAAGIVGLMARRRGG